MAPEVIFAIGAVASVITEAIKRYSPLEGRGVLLVCAGVALVCVLLYGVSIESAGSWNELRARIWPYFVAWVSVSTTAIGIYEATKGALLAAQGKKEETTTVLESEQP